MWLLCTHGETEARRKDQVAQGHSTHRSPQEMGVVLELPRTEQCFPQHCIPGFTHSSDFPASGDCRQSGGGDRKGGKYDPGPSRGREMQPGGALKAAPGPLPAALYCPCCEKYASPVLQRGMKAPSPHNQQAVEVGFKPGTGSPGCCP